MPSFIPLKQTRTETVHHGENMFIIKFFPLKLDIITADDEHEALKQAHRLFPLVSLIAVQDAASYATSQLATARFRGNPSTRNADSQATVS